ncbi:MAG: GNAT family N-acetyltransferase [Endomicrobium sp.]|jgi:ribosomal protein S18 acetylase RimI-like enzyme|nr:GNAT family N-acetyltransferase [Endomicrobium sp.]
MKLFYEKTFNLRHPVHDDLDEIMKLEEKCFPKEHRETAKTYEGRIKDFPEGALLLSCNNKIIGNIFGEIWKKDNFSFNLNHRTSDFLNKKGNILYISSFVITARYRKHFLGVFLLKEYLEYMKKSFPAVSECKLLVYRGWTRALNLYLKSGFSVEDKYEKYIIMNKKFKPAA